jgi:hypothetical protein
MKSPAPIVLSLDEMQLDARMPHDSAASLEEMDFAQDGNQYEK